MNIAKKSGILFIIAVALLSFSCLSFQQNIHADAGTQYVINGDFEAGSTIGANFDQKFPSWTKVTETVPGTMALKPADVYNTTQWLCFRKNLNSNNVITQQISNLPNGSYTLHVETAGDGCSSADIKLYEVTESGNQEITTLTLPTAASTSYISTENTNVSINSSSVILKITVNALANATYKLDNIKLTYNANAPKFIATTELTADNDGYLAKVDISGEDNLSNMHHGDEEVLIELKNGEDVLQCFEITEDITENTAYNVYFEPESTGTYTLSVKITDPITDEELPITIN